MIDLMQFFNLDRCDVTMADVVSTIIAVAVLIGLDYFYTIRIMFLIKELKPKSYKKNIADLEYNVIFNFYIRKFGLNWKTVVMQICTAIVLYAILLFIVPFLISVLIGFLVAVIMVSHVPNYKYLQQKVAKKKQKDRDKWRHLDN